MSRYAKSRGSQLLCGLSSTQQEIADACGRKQPLVAHWRSGLRVPGDADRTTLLRVYGIPPESWDEPASAHPASYGVISEDERIRGARELAQLTSRQATALLARIESDPASSTRERAAVMQAALSAATLLLRCELDEEKILSSPKWIQIERTIVEALRDFPDAARRVADALVILKR